MSEQRAPVLGIPAADLESAVRWLRSRYGPIHQAWDNGVLGLVDEAGVPSFRRILHLLDGSEADVRKIAIDDVPITLREVRAMFAMYRRLRRAAKRAREAAGGNTMSGTERPRDVHDVRIVSAWEWRERAEAAETHLAEIREIVGGLDGESTLNAVRDMATEWEHYSKEMNRAGYETIPALTQRAELAERERDGYAVLVGKCFRVFDLEEEHEQTLNLLRQPCTDPVAAVDIAHRAEVVRKRAYDARKVLIAQPIDDRAWEIWVAVEGMASVLIWRAKGSDPKDDRLWTSCRACGSGWPDGDDERHVWGCALDRYRRATAALSREGGKEGES